jgi:hypothetical protein
MICLRIKGNPDADEVWRGFILGSRMSCSYLGKVLSLTVDNRGGKSSQQEAFQQKHSREINVGRAESQHAGIEESAGKKHTGIKKTECGNSAHAQLQDLTAQTK